MNSSIKNFVKRLAKFVISKSSTANKLYRFAALRLGLWQHRGAKTRRPVIYSIVCNPGIFDSRVMKQARSLQDAGYDVKLYATKRDDLPDTHVVDGIEVRRFKPFDINIKMTDAERSGVLRLFGEDRALVVANLHEVGCLGADIATLLGQYTAISRQIARLSESDPDWAAGVAERELLRYKVKELTDYRRRVTLERRVFVYTYYFAANFLAQNFPETPTVIHSHDIYPLPGAIELARRTGARVVFDAHEIETERLPPLTPPKKSFVDRVERLWLSQIDHLIVCCDSAADFYAERFTKRRPQVVMNAPLMLEEHRTDFNLRTACGIDATQPLIIYTGGVGGEARGLHLVAEAMCRLPEFHLAVLGPRNPDYDRWLTEKSAAVGVLDRIHLLPPVPPEQVVAATRMADVGVCPIQDASLSYRYAMPNKLFEMAFTGMPICVSNLPEMARFVLENEVGVVMDQTDPIDIARALRETYERREQLRKTDGQLQSLLNKYAWPVQAEKLLQAYKIMEEVDVYPINAAA